MARGEWVLWLNVDDYLLPGILEFLISFLKKNTNQDMLYGHTVFVNSTSEKIRTLYQPQWFYWMTAIGNYAAPSTGSVYRRQVLLDDPLDTDYHMVMDSEWMLRAGRRLKVKRLNLEVVAFRISDDNKTAIHITTGQLTPRHRHERLKLAERYPYYSHRGETERGRAFYWLMALVRRCVRSWILIDKGCSRLKAGRRSLS